MSDYNDYFDELMNDKEKREVYFKEQKEKWSKPKYRPKLTKDQIEALKRLRII